MFVLLSAKLCGEMNDAAYRAASLVELLHTATLVHDDVVDDSMERRGFFSTYALWKAKANVLIGDYLLAKGLLLSLDNNDHQILFSGLIARNGRSSFAFRIFETLFGSYHC